MAPRCLLFTPVPLPLRLFTQCLRQLHLPPIALRPPATGGGAAGAASKVWRLYSFKNLSRYNQTDRQQICHFGILSYMALDLCSFMAAYSLASIVKDNLEPRQLLGCLAPCCRPSITDNRLKILWLLSYMALVLHSCMAA